MMASAALAAAPCRADPPPEGRRTFGAMTVAGPPSLYAVPPGASAEASVDAAGRGFAESSGGPGGIRIGRGRSASASTPAPVAPVNGVPARYSASAGAVPAPAAAAKANAEGGGETDQKALKMGAAGGLAGAALGFLVGGPIGAAAGFLAGLFIGALAAKMTSGGGKSC